MAHHKIRCVKDYEFIEHTADISIRVKGSDLNALFRNTALAMFDIAAQKRKSQAGKKTRIKIELKSDNLDELFVNWLNELLSLSATKDLIFSDFKISNLDNGVIEAIAIGENTANYKVNTEIKAATYHQLKLEEIKTGWQAEIIFDV
jgi:SHS2 domain-containing protein